MKKIFCTLLIIFVPLLLVALENKIQIKSIKIIGNERLSVQTIEFYVQLSAGDYVDDNDINLVVKNLYTKKLFESVSAYIDEEKNLVIKVKENPLIERIILQGNKLFDNKVLLANVIQSKEQSIFTETKLQSDLLNLVTTYRNNGRIGAKVKYELAKLDDNKVNLIFKINEGRTSKVKSVKFVGNKNFSGEELERIVKTHNNNIFSKLFSAIFKDTNHYSPQYLLISTELLDRFYSSHGYINNKIQPIVEIDDQNQAHVTFLVDEGQQYWFGSSKISIESEVHFEQEISGLVTEESNQVFNRVKVNNTVDKISKYLSEKGYVFAKVNSDYIEHGNVVDIVYKISPGKKIYVNQITINGNDRTLDQVIRSKLSITEGDPYNISEIQKSRRRLLGSDFFSSVKIDNYAVSDDAVDLNLNVKEKRTGVCSLSGGMSFPGGAFVEASVKEPNLFGTGKEFSFALKRDKYSFLTDVEIVENNFNYSDTSLGAGIFYETDEKPNSDFKSKSFGLSTKLSYGITENLTNSLRYFYKHNYIYRDNKEEKSIISAVGYTLTYNKLDNLYSPRDGYLLRLSQDVSGIGGNVHFLKSEALSFFARPILKKFDDDIIFRFKMAAGYIFSYTDKALGVDQHFFKGGNEIRGFELSGIGPRKRKKESEKNGKSLGGRFYFNATQQIDFPLPKLYDRAGIKGSLFIDYATLFDPDCRDGRCEDMYEDNKLLRISPGFGFSMPSPLGGRMRLDFGFPLVKESYDIILSPNVKFSIEGGI
ncbi:MAG: outer membrane protein assembly factor BamA [Wolbachia endosymbiont of Tyrophagus putrescentiae]|nr:outer membrane protein assembly factor BamA [Wolbachia endosymbiont of Tyrophagus putrescentiae]